MQDLAWELALTLNLVTPSNRSMPHPQLVEMVELLYNAYDSRKVKVVHLQWAKKRRAYINTSNIVQLMPGVTL